MSAASTLGDAAYPPSRGAPARARIRAMAGRNLAGQGASRGPPSPSPDRPAKHSVASLTFWRRRRRARVDRGVGGTEAGSWAGWRRRDGDDVTRQSVPEGAERSGRGWGGDHASLEGRSSGVSFCHHRCPCRRRRTWSIRRLQGLCGLMRAAALRYFGSAGHFSDRDNIGDSVYFCITSHGNPVVLETPFSQTTC